MYTSLLSSNQILYFRRHLIAPIKDYAEKIKLMHFVQGKKLPNYAQNYALVEIKNSYFLDFTFILLTFSLKRLRTKKKVLTNFCTRFNYTLEHCNNHIVHI